MNLNRSLGLRLLTFAGLAIALALTVAWMGLGALFERHAERQLQAELERHGLSLIAALSLDAEGRPVLSERPFDPRFERPASGLYWRVRSPQGERRSRSLWDGDLPSVGGPPPLGWATFNAPGPFEPQVMGVVRDIQLEAGGPQILVEVASDRRPLSDARAAFNRETAVFLALLWLALSVAAWMQVRLGLLPLERVRRELKGMSRAGTSRLADADHPIEIRSLTAEINAFADSRAAEIDRARHRARDLAHALKTPLTALRLQIEGLDPAAAREIGRSLSLVTGAVEGELARAGGVEEARTSSAASVVRRLLEVIGRTPDGARLSLDSDVPADLVLPLAEEAALEAVGALIENAARHAASRVRITGSRTGDAVRLEIADDGSGIPDQLRAAVTGRGVRLDERGARHGLGLAIASDFVLASGGTLTLEDAPGGGLLVVLAWGRRGARHCGRWWTRQGLNL